MTDHIIEAPQRPGHLDRETTLITQALSEIGKKWSFIPRKKVLNRTLHIDPNIPASGSIPFVRAAFACAGLPVPEDHSYPPELRHFLKRSIHETTLKTALRSNKPIFIKPSRKTKRFAGFVYSGLLPNDILGVPPSEPVWVSDIINIQAEWRTYCCNKKPLHTSWCDGNRNTTPDPTIIREICTSISENAPYAGGCAIDTAVTTTGQTVLLEINDGYSLGAYDNVSAMDYYLVIHNRWLASRNLQSPETLRA